MYKISIQGLNELRGAVKSSPKMVFNELSKAIRTSVNIIRPIMRGEAPNKTGKLSRNIEARAVGLEGKVGPNLDIVPYALWVHTGTRPYIILPRTKQALYWKGALHPVKKVRHPGIKANPFVERTYSQMKSPIQTIFNNTIHNITKNLTSK